MIEARTGDLRGAVAILVEAADTSEDGSLTLDALTEAMEADNYAGDYAHGAALGARAAAIEPHGEIDRFRVAALSGMGAELAGEYERADLLLREAIQPAEPARGSAGAGLGLPRGDHGQHGGRVRGRPAATPPAPSRSRGSGGCSASFRWRSGRRRRAFLAVGRFNLARSAAEEGISLASDFGHRSGVSWNLTNLALLDALRGDERGTRDHAREAIELAASGGGNMIIGIAEFALGLLELTLGKPDEATDRLLGLSTVERPESNALIGLWSVPDLIEAAARSGRLDEAGDRIERYTGGRSTRPPRRAGRCSPGPGR